MKFVVTAGGTAGHISPALAVSLELVSRGHELTFIGTPTGPESHLAPDVGLPFISLEAAGFDRAKPATLLTSSAKVLASERKAKALFKRDRPDCALGFGSYVSLPVGFAANSMHIPLVIHEQNSVPGMANKALAGRATYVALTYGMSKAYFKDIPDEKFVVVGNPVRASVLKGDFERGRKLYSIPDDAEFMLVFGGSLGAQHINNAVVSLADALLAHENLYVVQSTGKDKYDDTVAALGAHVGPRWQVYPYIDAMGDTLAACDFIVSRSGASTLAEICALGKPSLLVPFPHATDDHQTKNAADLKAAGACLMVPDGKLDTPEFSEQLVKLITDAGLRGTMAAAAKGLGRADAASRLADLAEQAAQGAR